MKNIDWNQWILEKNLQYQLEQLSKVARDMEGEKLDARMIMSELDSIIRNAENIKKHLNENDVAPDWVKSQVSKAANDISGVADYIMSIKHKK
jgi:hypothetical protein